LNTAKEFGADLTVKKPFDLDELADMVDRLVAVKTDAQ
jgi:hypothetical protein